MSLNLDPAAVSTMHAILLGAEMARVDADESAEGLAHAVVGAAALQIRAEERARVLAPILALLEREQAHAMLCSAPRGGCFRPSCSCQCHTYKRGIVSRADLREAIEATA